MKQLCSKCKTPLRSKTGKKLTSADIEKMLKIMKKHNLSQNKLASLLGISQPTVSGWFFKGRNLTGRINKKYFDELKEQGYK
jgi:DNA-binding transcriptional regulator YiaG